MVCILLNIINKTANVCWVLRSSCCLLFQWPCSLAVIWATFSLCCRTDTEHSPDRPGCTVLCETLAGQWARLLGGWGVILGIKTGFGGVCCPNARGRVRNRKSNPEGVSPRDLTYCSHKPECIGTTNLDRSVLITIITWHFQFHPVNVSNLHVKGAYVLEARAVSRTPPIVTSSGAP